MMTSRTSLLPRGFTRALRAGHRPPSRPRGHTLVEMMAAMVSSVILLAGLGSAMFIGSQIANTPTAASARIDAAQIVHELADEVRWATAVFDITSKAVEFVIADRDHDGASERIRYEWSGTPGEPLRKSINGTPSTIVATSVQNFSLEADPQLLESITAAGHTFSRNCLARLNVTLQTGIAAHSRVDSSVELANRPEHLANWWRLDFDANPTTLDMNQDGAADWQQLGGGSFNSAHLSGGFWQSSSFLQSLPANDFTGVTIVEARLRGDNVGMRIPADRGGGRCGAITLTLLDPGNGSRTLQLRDDLSNLLRDVDTSAEATLANLADRFIRVRLTILPVADVVVLHVNEVLIGKYLYPRPTNADGNDRHLWAGVLAGAASFDYLEVRVRP